MAGFTGTCGDGDLDPIFCQFDDGLGVEVPDPDSSGFRNEPIRQRILEDLNASAAYRNIFGQSFPEVAAGEPIDFSMFGRAIAEFEFTLVFTNAPIDKFARGQTGAMTDSQKRGALLFFGKAKCVQCHATAGQSNEMFSDFQMHVIGVPQIAPFFGAGAGNMIFDGPNQDEDFGLEQITGKKKDRYMFRTSPIRNVALQPAFFHNGAFTRLEDAIWHHLNVHASALGYNPAAAGVDPDLSRVGPIEPVLARLDPILASPIELSGPEFDDLVDFVRNGLLDERADPKNLCKQVPKSVPSGLSVLNFEECP